MKKLAIVLSVSVLSLAIGIYIVANSSTLLRMAADRFLPRYGIAYDTIQGDVLHGVTVEKIRFHDRPLATSARFRWQPLSLLHGRLSIGRLAIADLNVTTLEALGDTFGTKRTDTKRTSESYKGLSVHVGRLDVSLAPYRNGSLAWQNLEVHAHALGFGVTGATIGEASLDIRDLRSTNGVPIDSLHVSIDDTHVASKVWEAYDLRALRIGDFSLSLKSEAGDIDARGEIDETLWNVDRLTVQRLSPERLLRISDRNETASTATSRSDSASTKILWPQRIALREANMTVLPWHKERFRLENASVSVRDAVFDIAKRNIEKGEVSGRAQTGLSRIVQKGRFVDNRFEGTVILTPTRRLFKLYRLPLRKEAIGDVHVDFNLTKSALDATLRATAKNVYLPSDVENNETDAGSYEIDIDALHAHAVLSFDPIKLHVESEATIATPYVSDAALTNRLSWRPKGEIDYTGTLRLQKVRYPDANLSAMLEGATLRYRGDIHGVVADVNTSFATGRLDMSDFDKNGTFTLNSTHPLPLRRFVALPAELNATEVRFEAKIPIDPHKPFPLHMRGNISSDALDIDIDAQYARTLAGNIDAHLSEKSLLKVWQPKVKWEAFFPAKIRIDADENRTTVNVKSLMLEGGASVDMHSEALKGRLKLSGIDTAIEGKLSGGYVLMADVKDFSVLSHSLGKLYRFDRLPEIHGSLYTALTLDEEGNLMWHMNASDVRYRADRKTVHELDNVAFSVSKHRDSIVVDAYNITYNGMNFYASSPSEIRMRNGHIVPHITINDSLTIDGDIAYPSLRGNLYAKSRRFAFRHPYVDLNASVDIRAKMDGNATSVEGKVTLLDTDIMYDLTAKTFPSDSDIVIVQEQTEKKPNPFWDNTTVLIDVDTAKPIRYRRGPIDLKADAEIVVNKAPYSEPMLLGRIDIVDGSSYTFEGKRFVLKKSHIFLTGDIAKPLLDLKVKYKAFDHLITITVSGTPAAPNLIFSSVPYLTKEQILSVILFDSADAAGTNDANDMMRMMGGAVAKAALNDLGVKIDHLAVGANNSVEVGKKISDDVTVIYINGEVPEVKMKYEYNPHVDVVFGASEKSQSVDIIYKKDFATHDDIVVKRKESKP